MAENYSYTKYDGNIMARAKIEAAPVSTKHGIEISSFLKGKNTKKAISYLIDVLAKEKAIPFKRFNGGVGHRTSISGPGRYPVKAVAEVKRLVESAVANATSKGLNADNLFIVHIKANEGARPFHSGRQKRRAMKRTNFEIVIMEKTVEKKAYVKKADQEDKAKAPKKEKSEPKSEKKLEAKATKETKKADKPEAKKEAKEHKKEASKQE